jgi:hypothetical protein
MSFTGIDLAQDPAWHSIFFSEPDPRDVAALARYLRSNRDNLIRLYHGTSAQIPVFAQGLKPTTFRTKKSLQSSMGFVYLSVYPGRAHDFGKLAYPGKDIAVYVVDIPIRLLKPDKDQLDNQRCWAQREIGDTLAESLAYGHGVRVKGKIDPCAISFCRSSQLSNAS